MSFFISNAYAAEGAAAQSSPMFTVLMLVAFVAVFYFIAWRPQSKQRKAHQALMGSLAKGDEVVTSSGIVGKIAQIDDEYVMLSMVDGREIQLLKMSISKTLPKGSLKKSN